MDPKLVKILARPLPRYTSYPTAPHFNANVGTAEYDRWLSALSPDARLSLYVHIPFCDTLCWFCACTTKITRRYAPVGTYLSHVCAEIDAVAERIPNGVSVSHIHWGGGSPDILSTRDMARLSDTLRSRFIVEKDAEFAVEIDPREMDEAKIAALAQAGLTRISLGVQDFDPKVQTAINRLQSFEQTRAVVEEFRNAGVHSINIDLVYGLPHQTTESGRQTIEAVIALGPDRVATFGYAHLPNRIRHQRLIDNESVPGIHDRLALSQMMSAHLRDAGYVQLGVDHFCKPGDSMASTPLRRNFQGYTTDTADALLGLGASAISRLPQGYVQNAVPIADYQRRIGDGGVATARGLAFTPEDMARAFAIETLMCELRFPASELCREFGELGVAIAREGERLAAHASDGLVEQVPDGFVVTEKGRPFLRALAAEFDAYLDTSKTVHSTGI